MEVSDINEYLPKIAQITEDTPLLRCDFDSDSGAIINTGVWFTHFINEEDELTQQWADFDEVENYPSWPEAVEDFMKDRGYELTTRESTFNLETNFDTEFLFEVYQSDPRGEWVHDTEAVVVFYISEEESPLGSYSGPIFSSDNDTIEYTMPMSMKAGYQVYELSELSTLTEEEINELGDQSFSDDPWDEILQALGRPESCQMIEGTPVWTFGDATQIQAVYYPL